MQPIYYVIIALGVLLILWIAGTYNRLQRLRYGVREGFSTMDVYLKKRYDLIPNLVETVKQYASHEKSVFEDTARLRSKALTASTMEEKVSLNNALNDRLGYLNVIAEQYPELKADLGFRKLQTELSKIEEDIADARLYYNGNVKVYNTTRETFPNMLLAGPFGFKPEPFFAMETADRSVVPEVGSL